MYKINYNPITGEVSSIQKGNLSFETNYKNSDFRDFLAWNAKQEIQLNWKTPIHVEKPAPEPTQTEKIAALEAMVKRLSGDTKQTDEDIDLMAKTGLITDDEATAMKAGE